LEDCSLLVSIGTIWSASPSTISVGTATFHSSRRKSVLAQALAVSMIALGEALFIVNPEIPFLQ
jgi:hypothetical protein